jgi:flagellar protein FliS
MTYGYARSASALYQQNKVQGSVEDADPHRLIGLLLDGAIERINQAIGFMTFGNVPAKGNAISRSVAIVAELRNSLDHKADPALSQRLESLYDYVTRRLLYAQLNDDRAALVECVGLLTPVRDGWQGIRQQYLASAQKPAGVA